MASEPNKLWTAHRNPYPRLIGPGTVLGLPSHISDAELLAWTKVADYLNTLEAKTTHAVAELKAERRERIKFGDALMQIESCGMFSSISQMSEQIAQATKARKGSKHATWMNTVVGYWSKARDGWYAERDAANDRATRAEERLQVAVIALGHIHLDPTSPYGLWLDKAKEALAKLNTTPTEVQP